jgi:hypothetical protein
VSLVLLCLISFITYYYIFASLARIECSVYPVLLQVYPLSISNFAKFVLSVCSCMFCCAYFNLYLLLHLVLDAPPVSPSTCTVYLLLYFMLCILYYAFLL